MCALFDQTLETGPARAAVDRLVYSCVLTRLTNGDTHTQLACSMFADPGTAKAAVKGARSVRRHRTAELTGFVCPTFNAALSLAVGYMHRACRQLGYDPAGLSPDHIAILASVFAPRRQARRFLRAPLADIAPQRRAKSRSPPNGAGAAAPR
jgi:hypothetical protein